MLVGRCPLLSGDAKGPDDRIRVRIAGKLPLDESTLGSYTCAGR